MTIAIKRENSDLIWFDAVLQFGEQYQSSVTKHKLASGANISDHTVIENAVYTVSGLVSGVDFNTKKFVIGEEDRKNYSIQNEVNKEVVAPTLIFAERQNPLVKLLPDSIKQFLTSDKAPEVVMQEQRSEIANPVEFVKNILITLNRGTLALVNGRVVEKKELVTLVEFDPRGKIIKTYPSLVLTSLSFRETADTGYAIYPEMTFEEVRYTTVETTTIPKNVADAIKNQASAKADKGKQQVVEGSTTPTAPLDAKTGATDFKPQAQQSTSSALKQVKGAVQQ